jgi:hypothetical protein
LSNETEEAEAVEQEHEVDAASDVESTKEAESEGLERETEGVRRARI